MSKREWMPVEYIDEITPPWRASPDAWIDEVKDGAAILGGDDVDGEFRLTVKVGDVVAFSWQEPVAELTLRIWDDHFVADGELPDSGFDRLCTTYGQGGFLAYSLDDFIGEVRKAEAAMMTREWPVEVEALFYRDDQTAGARFRLVDAGGALRFVPAEHVQ